MKAIGINFCKFEECTKKASYGYERPVRCLSHREPDMKSFNKNYCSFDTCRNRPFFGLVNEKPTRCESHKETGMVNSKRTECLHCSTSPTYGHQGGRFTHCAKHKEPGMVYLMFPTCTECAAISRFGLVKNRPTHCSRHRKEGMWNVIDRTCNECSKRPTYGYVRAEYCSDHKKDDMKVFARTFCQEEGCSKTACFNYTGSTGALYCTTHAKKDMINIWEKKCLVCWSSRARKYYDGHCAQCFSHAFPDNPKVRKFKTKERAIKDFLNEKYPDSLITHDKAVDCSRFRPDFVIELGSHVVVVEVDENQHDRYDTSCENKRLMSIFQGLGSRPMVMLRFNPDKYINFDGKHVKGCWYGSGFVLQKQEWKSRLKVLSSIIDNWWSRVPEKEVTIEHLFYDGFIGPACGPPT
jgi:EsV-1-7 cysteine-rich motif